MTNALPAWLPAEGLAEAMRALDADDVVVVTEGSPPTVARLPFVDVPPGVRAAAPELAAGKALVIFRGGRRYQVLTMMKEEGRP